MEGHVVPRSTYFMVFGSLLALTALTTGVAFVDLGPWNTVAALIIACCKATLVVVFFMHLRWSSRLLRMVLPSVLLWLVVLISMTVMDFASRDWTPVPKTWDTSVTSPTPGPAAAKLSSIAKTNVAKL